LKLYTIIKEVYLILVFAYCGLFRFNILFCCLNAFFNIGYVLFDSFSFFHENLLFLNELRRLILELCINHFRFNQFGNVLLLLFRVKIDLCFQFLDWSTHLFFVYNCHLLFPCHDFAYKALDFGWFHEFLSPFLILWYNWLVNRLIIKIRCLVWLNGFVKIFNNWWDLNFWHKSDLANILLHPNS